MNRTSRDVRDLLSDPQKGVNRAKGILCYLFRDVLLWKGVNQFSWKKRANRFFEKPHNIAEGIDKGNLNKALVNDDFTWGTFKKAIDFLDPKGATLTIVLTWRSEDVSRYTVVIDPGEDESDPVLNQFGVEPEDAEIFQRGNVSKSRQKKPANTLARLFRKIVTQEGITLTQWEGLLNAYARNPVNGIGQTPREINQAVVTLQRDLLLPRMTWGVFRKGILLLSPKIEEYILELRWGKDDITQHSVALNDPLNMVPPTDKNE